MATDEIKKLKGEVSQLQQRLDQLSDYVSRVRFASYLLWSMYDKHFKTKDQRSLLADLLGISEKFQEKFEKEYQESQELADKAVAEILVTQSVKWQIWLADEKDPEWQSIKKGR